MWDVHPVHGITCVIDEERCATQECYVRVAAQEIELTLEPIMHADIVCVQPGDIGTVHERTGLVERADDTGIVLMDHSDPRVASRILLQNRRGPVGRAVVDDQDSKILD